MHRSGRCSTALAVAVALMLGLAACSDPSDPVVDTGTVRGDVYRLYSREGVGGARVSCGGVAGETDASGAYRLTGVPQGERELTVQAAGYRDHRRALDVVEFQTVSLELTPTDTLADLSGLVRHRLDGPLQVQVTIGDTTLTTDIDGRYVLADWPIGRYDVTIDHPAYMPYDTTVAVYEDGQFLAFTLLRETRLVFPVAADAAIHWDDDDQPGNNHGTGTTVSVAADPDRSVLYGFDDSRVPDDAMVQSLTLRFVARVPGNIRAEPWTFSLMLRGISTPWFETSVDAVNHPEFFAVPGGVTIAVPAFTDTLQAEIDVTGITSPLPFNHVYGAVLDAAGPQTPDLVIFAREIEEFFPDLVPSYELVYVY